MHAAEIEKGHIEIHGGDQMLQRLAESQAQPRKASKMRAYAQIRPFNMTRGDSRGMWVADDRSRDRRCNTRWRIPVWPLTFRASVQLNELGEVHACPEAIFDGRNVGLESVCSDLEVPVNALAQIVNEFVCALAIALAGEVRQNQFGFAVNRHPNVGIAPLGRIAGEQVFFFGVNESPEFISLDEARTNIPHFGVEQIPALFPDCKQQRQNRSLVSASNARYGADAHAFEQELRDLCGLFSRNVVTSKRLLARFGKSGIAGRAAITLYFVAIESKTLCFGVLAADARHGLFSLSFLCEKPYNQVLGFDCGLRSLLNQAPSLALTSDGAFSFHVAQFPPRSWINPHRLQKLIGLCGRLRDISAPKSRKPKYPTIGGNTFNHGSAHLVRFESTQRRRNRSQRVGRICSKVKTACLETVPNIGNGQELSARFLKDPTNGVRKAGVPNAILLNGIVEKIEILIPDLFIRNHVGRRVDKFAHFHEFHFDCIPVSRKRSHLCDGLSEHIFKVRIIHGRIVDNVYNKVKEICGERRAK